MTSEERQRWQRAEATRKRRLRTRQGKRDPWRNAQPAQLRQPEQSEAEEQS